MASLRLIWPSGGSNAAYSGAGLTNPTNVQSDNGVYATASLTAAATALGTKYGNWGWDSTIPAGSAINDVQFEYQHKDNSGGTNSTKRMRARISGTDQAAHDTTDNQAADTTVGPTSIFADRAWTRTDLLDGTFEFVMEARWISGAFTVSFDYIAVTVDWTPPNPPRPPVMSREAKRRSYWW